MTSSRKIIVKIDLRDKGIIASNDRRHQAFSDTWLAVPEASLGNGASNLATVESRARAGFRHHRRAANPCHATHSSRRGQAAKAEIGIAHGVAEAREIGGHRSRPITASPSCGGHWRKRGIVEIAGNFPSIGEPTTKIWRAAAYRASEKGDDKRSRK